MNGVDEWVQGNGAGMAREKGSGPMTAPAMDENKQWRRLIP